MRSSKPESRLRSANLILRLMLRHDELFRLPPTSRGVQVVAGSAWLTVAGEDIFLQCGQTLWLLSGKDSTLVSALGQAPLILEILGDRSSSLGALMPSQQGC